MPRDRGLAPVARISECLSLSQLVPPSRERPALLRSRFGRLRRHAGAGVNPFASIAPADLEPSRESRRARPASPVPLSVLLREFPSCSLLETPASLYATHITHSQTPRCRCACRMPCREPARRSCMPLYPRSPLASWLLHSSSANWKDHRLLR